MFLNKRRSFSLVQFLTRTFMGLVLFTTIVVSVIVGSVASKFVIERVGEGLSQTAYHMADKLNAYMMNRSGEIQTLAQLDLVDHLEDPEELREILETVEGASDEFSWIGIMDVEGTVLAATNGHLEGLNISQRPVFYEGLKGHYFGNVHEAVLLAELLPNKGPKPLEFVDISHPIYNREGKVIGVVGSHLDWSYAERLQLDVLRPLEKGKHIDLLIVDSANQRILMSPPGGKEYTFDPKLLATIMENGFVWKEEIWNDGIEYLAGYATEKGEKGYELLNWYVIVRQRSSEAYQVVWNLRLVIFAIGILSVIIFTLIAHYVARRIAAPIENIAHESDEILSGKREQISEYYGIEEIESLSSSLRALLSNLLQKETDLAQMENIALTDTLTGISNRSGFIEYLQRAMTKALILHDVVLIFMLDLDGFKSVNDGYGHDAGDAVLVETAKRLQSHVRYGEIVARLGGDEFVIVLLMNGPVQISTIENIASRIIETVARPISYDDYELRVGCSIGISQWSEGEDVEEVLKKADEMMYRSKRQGKNCYHIEL